MADNLEEKIREEFKWIEREVLWLHGKWKIYCQLFLESPRRIDLLNTCAGSCFYVFQQVLLDAIQLSLSKLTDHPRNKKQENLSLELLQERLTALGDTILYPRLRAILDDLQAKCNVLKKHRNKRLAHFDLDTALKQGANMDEVSKEMIEDALELLREYVNAIEQHYFGTSTGYGILENVSEEANRLVEVIIQGMNFRNRFPYLVKEGKLTREDVAGPWTGA